VPAADDARREKSNDCFTLSFDLSREH
jgi:hypothetical protein